MLRHRAIAAALAIFVAVPATAAVTITPGGGAGSTTDPLNGATVTANSAVLNGFTVQDAFGSVTKNGPYEESLNGGNVIFDANSGETSFINFETATSTLLSGINVFVASDGPTNAFRAFTSVTLFAGISPESLVSLGQQSIAPGAIGSQTISYSFAPVAYQYFRFEGVNFNGGARLAEIDGISAAPEPATWAMMIFGFGFAGAMLRRRRGLEGLPA